MNNKKKVGYIILFSNIFLFLIKLLAWLLTGSIAVKSEAFNSFVDSIYSFIIITGFFASNREKTSNYPEGLIRLEPIISLFVASLIFLTGAKIAYDSLNSLIQGESYIIEISYIAYIVLIVGILVKYIMYIYIKEKAKEYNSPSLAATAVDNKNDILTTLVAFVGVIGKSLNTPEVESIAAILIAIYVSYSGIKIAEENVEYALGASVSDNVRESIKKSALSNKEVSGIHDFETHYTGPMIDVSMHLEVSGNITIEEGHKIEIDVADNIRENCSKSINEINIHLDPKSLDEWKNLSNK